MQAIIRNVYMVIKGTEEEKQKVKDVLTFEDNSAQYTHLYQRSKWDGKVRLYRDKDFGLVTLPGFKDYLMEKLGDKISFEDNRERLIPKGDYWNISVKLRDYQEEAVLQALKIQRGVILIPTAGGKTYIAAAILKGFLNCKCVYIVHRVVLLRQVKAVLESSLKESVGILGSGEMDLNHRVIVAMIGTLYSKSKTNKAVIDWMNSVSVGIVDEVQHGSAKTYVSVLNRFQNMMSKIGLTGTLPDDEVVALRIRGVIGEVIYKIETKELSEDGFVVMPKVTMVTGEWDVGLKAMIKGINWYKFGAEREAWNIVRRYGIVTNVMRNQKIVNVVKSYIDKGVRGIFVIVDMIEHGEILSQMLNVPFIYGGAKDRLDLFDDFKIGKIPVLVTSPVLEEGIDVTGIKMIVLAAGGKSKIKLLQRIGRGMRKQRNKFDCDIVDFYDQEINLLEKHSDKRIKTYKEEGFLVEQS